MTTKNKEYFITLLFGREARGEYERKGKAPEEDWFEENGGYLNTFTFDTEEAYNAFVLGIEKAESWPAITTIESNG